MRSSSPLGPVITVAIVLTFVLLPAAYMGSYYGMLAGEDPRGISFSAGGPFMPQYRSGGCRTFYKPAHEIDLRLRSEYWNFKKSNSSVPR